MLFSDIQVAAQNWLDSGLSADEIKTLIKSKVGDETIVDADGNEVSLKKIKLEEKVTEKVEDISIEVTKAVKKAVEAEIAGTIKPKIFQPENKIRVEGKRFGSLKYFKTEEAAYKSGKWLLATIFGNKNAADWCDDNGMSTKQDTLQEGTGTNANLGSYLVPDELSATIIDLSEQYGIVRRNARIEPMASDLKYVPILNSNTAASWTAEAGAINQTDMTFERVTLTAKKLAAYVKLTSEVMSDAVVNLAQTVTADFARAIAFATDYAALKGNGSADYGSVLGLIQAMTDVANNAGEVNAMLQSDKWAQIVLDDFNTLMGVLPVYADNTNTKFYCSKQFFHQVMAKVLAAAGGNFVSTLESGFSGGPRTGQFLGYPVEFSSIFDSDSDNPSDADPPVIFGDLSQAIIIGDKGSIEISINPWTDWKNDIIDVRAIQRLAINASWNPGTSSVAGAVVYMI